MKKSLAFFIACGLTIPVAHAQPARQSTSPWPALKNDMRPFTRWWWMGNAVDDKNTARLLDTYRQAGFGGVELTPIYGAIGYENRYLPFLSPQWMQALQFTVAKAHALGMEVDMNTGTGWPFGGPQITSANAAAKLIIQTYKMAAGETLAAKIVAADARQVKAGAPLQALTAYGDNGEILSLLDRVGPDGTLSWQAPKGNWTLYAAFSGKTLQQVKRAAPGGEGNVMDHLSAQAVNTYLQRFDTAFRGKSPGIGAFFNDSYEVYGASWSPGLFDEFKRRRGYDLRGHLRELAGTDTTEAAGRVKSDYRETMGQMLLDNFTANWTSWTHRYHSLSRNQAHGSPGNLLDLYGAVDIPECETFGSSKFDIPGLRRDSADVRNVDPDPIMLKFASSAANVNGKPYTSSETFTWLAEHFKGSLSQCKPELEQVFLSGVNHVFFHGTTYSPADIPFPGWLFYASTNFVPANSFWPHLPGLNTYITRCQSVLQSGKADNELLIYWPMYDAWSNPTGMDMPMAIHGIDKWLHPTSFYQSAIQLQRAGYSFDFISDNMIAQSTVVNEQLVTAAAAPARKMLLVPACHYMPLETLVKIIQLAEAGATIVFQQLPQDVPGWHDLDTRRRRLKTLLATFTFTDIAEGVKKCTVGKGQLLLAGEPAKSLAWKGIDGETLTATGLKFIRRQIPGGKYYYLVNHTSRPIDTNISLNYAAAGVLIMDPQNGAYGKAASEVRNGKTSVHIQMQPGEALFLKATAAAIRTNAWKYIGKTATPIAFSHPWNLHFTQGGPTLPANQLLSELSSWTNAADSNAASFSGSAEYTTTVDIPAPMAGNYLLNLGRVCESAHVYINGADAGNFWSIPFSARVGKWLKPGKNTIKIEVANLMANRIRYMDQQGIQWRKYHEINFVNINYQPFDASKWTVMPSGLLGPVVLTPIDEAP